MDRRYGGDPQAPPRPPKTVARVHRPRAPDPLIMNESLQQQQQQQPQPQSTNATIITRHLSTIQPQQQLHLQSPLIPRQQTRPAPTTAPLVSSLQSSASFSRRRPPPQTLTIPTISSFSLNLNNIESPLTPVTLAAPRPENERLANEYVDTPFRTPNPSLSRGVQAFRNSTNSSTGNTTGSQAGGSHNVDGRPVPIVSATNINAVASTIGTAAATTTATTKSIVPHNSTTFASSTSAQSITTAPTTTSTANLRPAIRPSVLPVTAITKQPISFSKDPPTAAIHEDVDIHPSNGEALNSITCPQCKRCRCEECQRPRQLPSRWVCDKTCFCSAETIIDYATCLCCAKALFYHCSKDHEMDRDGNSISCVDDPCSCLPHKRAQRWAWLGALSLALPCLWCYWPMRGCVALCAKCYARHTRHGCRCPQIKLSNNSSGITIGGTTGASIGRTISRTCDLTPEKRLLDSSPEY